MTDMTSFKINLNFRWLQINLYDLFETFFIIFVLNYNTI